MKRFLGARVQVKPTWPTLRPRVVEALAAVPGGEAVVALEARPVLRWQDGPGESTVAAALGEPAGWGFTLVEPADDEPDQLWLDRSFTDEALAVGIVRFQASHPLPYDSQRADHRAALRQILDEDEPARSGYPLTDAMAELLLAAAEPPDAADAPTPADRLSRRLAAAGHEALWNQAWAGVEL